MKTVKTTVQALGLLFFFIMFAFIPITYGDQAEHIDPGIQEVEIVVEATEFESTSHGLEINQSFESDDFLMYILAENDIPVCDEVYSGNSYGLVSVNISDCIRNELLRNRPVDRYYNRE